MLLPAARTRDTLNSAALPPTDNTELNYRTRPNTSEEERRSTLKVLSSGILLAAPLGLIISWLLTLTGVFYSVIGAACTLFLVRALVRFVRGRRATEDLLIAAFIGLTLLLGALLSALPSSRYAYSVYFPSGVGMVAAASLVLGRQIAFWMAANPKVDWETARKWEGFFPAWPLRAIPEECPETRSVLAMPFLLLLAYGFGWLVLRRFGGDYGPLFGAVGFLVTLLIFATLWRLGGAIPNQSFRLTLRVTWLALTVFCTYNRHRTKAAGIFRFPTPELVEVRHRAVFVGTLLVVLGTALVALLPPFFPTEQTSGDKVQPPRLLAHEEEYLRQLPQAQAEAKRREIQEARTPKKVSVAPVAATGRASLRLVIAAAVVLAGPAVLLLVILHITVGPLLTRYYLALEAVGGYAQSDTENEWDIYVDRILQSNDALEKEHFLLGFSVYGDYPVLLHQEILDQHVHLTGDTGASKTTLGIAPLATQLIARKDNSSVIIDLKGDMALFESCRIEARRAGLPFRWFATEPGKTSFVFNPFMQSHLGLLNPEQRTESLLQALSLDYGVGYGKGFFTAMNEVVLKNLLRAYTVRSFRELGGLLEDPAAYREFGAMEDWRQARHLAALVNRLGGMHPLNVIPNRDASADEVSLHAIDAMDVLHRPQVLYFFLSSAQESIGAPSVAKLFLWALFGCAARRPARANRVYVFIDEFQQIISDSVKLIFEQIRDQGVTMVVAHQTVGQLERQDSDLSETIESCTAVKQVFRASDLKVIKKLEEASGNAIYHSLSWTQTYDAESGDEGPDLDPALAEESLVQVSQTVGPRLDRNTILDVSADRQASLVRFTFGSKYTQFGAYTTPIVSQFPISFGEYRLRKKAIWPTAAGTVIVPLPNATQPMKDVFGSPPTPLKPDREDGWEERLRRGLLP